MNFVGSNPASSRITETSTGPASYRAEFVPRRCAGTLGVGFDPTKKENP